jgi:hypothetical protein
MGDKPKTGKAKAGANAQNREGKRVIGRPFTPGNSANPGGRPHMTPEEREKWKALANKCLARLNDLADDEDASPQFLVKCAEVAANRAWGTPTQAIELTGPNGGPIEFSEMTDEELDARLKAMKAAE